MPDNNILEALDLVISIYQSKFKRIQEIIADDIITPEESEELEDIFEELEINKWYPDKDSVFDSDS